jgi:mono/diheme cytochrome c family protein
VTLRQTFYFLSGLIALFVVLGVCLPTPPARSTPVPAYQAGTSAEALLLKELLTELKGLRGDVQALAGKSAVADKDALVRLRCGSCHGADSAKDKGDDFVLVEKDGSLTPLSFRDKRLVREAVESGRMPKGRALSAEERKSLVEKFP